MFTHNGKKTTLSDMEAFFAMLQTNQLGKDDYITLVNYGKKVLNNTSHNIPFDEIENIVRASLAKAINTFDDSKGANFLTHFNWKLREERQSYFRSVKKMQKTIKGALEEGNYETTYDKDGNAVLIETEERTAEEELIESDVYFRQRQAFRISMSSLPKISQFVLKNISMGKTIKEIVMMLEDNLNEIKVKRIRNSALTLLFKKVLRSKHLSTEEKKDIIIGHGLERVVIEEQEDAQDEIYHED
jgi:hypothetical protein